MPDRDPYIANKILRRLNILTAAGVVLALALIALVIYVALVQRQTTDALCQFKNDLISRNNQSKDFLARHPHGAFGFSPAQIQQSIDNYDRTINALSSVHCPPPPTP